MKEPVFMMHGKKISEPLHSKLVESFHESSPETLKIKKKGK